MFKKLKQKITEEQQSPQRSGPGPSRQPQDHLPSGNRSRTSSLTEQQDEGSSTPDKENTSRSPFSSSPDAVNGNEVSASQRNEQQSFTQKLQLRVPSMESLFRSPVKESLFRSPSKESLVRSSSRDSLNRLDTDGTSTTFDPPSDIESEAEESLINLEGLSKEQLYHRLRRMERSLGNYRGKYSELVTTYRIVQREKEKLQSVMSQSQDKSLRRISELREELQMDQQAKKHLQEEFDASLEEKDQLISVLQTQVSLLKQRLGSGQANTELPEQPVESDSTTLNLTQEINSENASTPADGSGDAVKTLEGLQVRVRRQENLLQRCKDMIQSHKERAAQLSNENETLQEQLQERLQELEKIKELHTGEKSKLINQLRDAKNKIEQLEQDKGMVIAETKRQMHEALEIKEEEVSQLRVRVKQLITQCDELREQKEKSEKAAFEELEKALRTSQKTEEARKQAKAQMDEQIMAIEKASEDERRNLQQELSRVKQEVVDIMKKSSEERIAKLEQVHMEQLASKDQELKERLQTQELEFAEQMKVALVKSREEYLNTIQTKEQDCLALEELELQKKAIQSQNENRLHELQQETETFRTRILELESSLAKCSEERTYQAEEQAAHIESERNKCNTEITNMVEKHKEELDRQRQELENVWMEKLHLLKQEHNSKMEELIEKNQSDHDALLKEKETLFQAHIEEMNEKTLEKLDVKQTELEAVSSELSEALKAHQELEQKLTVLRNEKESLILELDTKLEQERSLNNAKIDTIEKEKNISAQELQRSFKDEVVTLEHKLHEKQKELEEMHAQVQALTKAANTSEAQVVQMTAKLEDVCQSHKNNSNVQVQLYEAQLGELQQRLADIEAEKSQLKDKEEATESQLMNISTELSAFKNQVNELQKQLEEQNDEVVQKLHSLTQQHESEKKCFSEEREHAIKDAADKEKEIVQMRALQTQQMEDFKQKLKAEQEKVLAVQGEYEKKLKNQESKMEKLKQKAKEMQETFKRKLSEQESKFKKEIENKQLELSEKEKKFNEKMLEMAQADSTGINDAVSQLERNHKEQLESLSEGHRRELEKTTQTWAMKLQHHIDELQEKHKLEFQEKELELSEVKQKLDVLNCEKDEAKRVIEQLKEEQANKDITFKELQEQSSQAFTQVTALLHEQTSLKSKFESVEVDLSRTLGEQLDELLAAGEKDRSKVTELVDMLKEANKKIEVLESSHSKQGEFEKQLEDKLVAAQQKENEFYKLSRELSTRLQTCCTDTEASLQASASDFNEKCNDKINVVIARMTRCQNQVSKLKGAIMLQAGKIFDLEAQLEQVNTQHTLLASSLQKAIQNLQDKQNEIITMREEIQCLNTQKEALQKEGGHHQEEATEKESCITKLKKELSENSNALTVMQEELRGKESQINCLNMQVKDLRANLENSIGIAEKEASRYSLSKQHEDEMLSKIETISHERAMAFEQLDHSKNKLAEWKKKAESRFTQNHNTIKELQAKLDITNQQITEKDELVCRLKEEFDQQSKGLDSLKAEAHSTQTVGEKKQNDFTAELETKKVRIEELENDISKITKENQCIVEEMKRQIRQRDVEHKELVQQLQNAQVTVFDKDNRYMEAEQKALNLEKEMATLKTELETRQRDFELLRVEMVASKEDAVKTLEIRLTESAAKHSELKKKAEQKIAAVKKQLISQVEEKDRYKLDLENQLQDLKQKMQERENRVKTLEVKIKSIEDSSGLEKEEMQRAVQNVKASIEQEKASMLENVRHMYEEKIIILQKDSAEKERELQRQRDELEEKNISESKMQSTYEVLQQNLVCAEKDRQQQQTIVVELQHQLESQKQKYSMLSAQHKEKEGELTHLRHQLQLKEKELKDLGKVVEELQTKHHEGELSMKEKDETILKEKEAHKLQTEDSSLKHEATLKDLQEQLDKKDVLIRTFEENAADKAKSDSELQKLLGDLQSQLKDLHAKLDDAEKDKQKLCKEVAKAQKDLRVLRKEQQQELDIMKKELADETEQKIKHEQEDLELKHNSTLKQLMREFNTQMAKKERELETAVQETISKAQEVEAELMQSHQIEATQLHRRIAEKNDDLKRTVKKYEEILEAREEEMTAKVSELQTKLEELQSEHSQVLAEQEYRNSEEVTVADFQTQLSEKTSLLNEAKLKEQEFKEQVHMLADQLKKYERNVFVTPLGMPYRDGHHRHTDVSAFGEPTEFEYLRKVMYEYMMGRETKTMAKVITTVLRFPADQAQKILEKEESKPLSWLRPST